jgi:hypothetical protein
MGAMNITDRHDPQRLRDLADRLDCLTEDDFNLLTETAPATTQSWRKRGTGPGYILAGNRVLYPRAEVEKFLRSKVREPRAANLVRDAL